MKLIVLYCITFISLASCAKKKSIDIIGFVHEKDSITIYNKNDKVYAAKVRNIQDKFGYCTLNDQVKVFIKNNTTELSIQLDSAGFKLIDTIILVPNNNQSPFIMFVHPKDRNLKRTLFLGDSRNYIEL